MARHSAREEAGAIEGGLWEALLIKVSHPCKMAEVEVATGWGLAWSRGSVHVFASLRRKLHPHIALKLRGESDLTSSLGPQVSNPGVVAVLS